MFATPRRMSLPLVLLAFVLIVASCSDSGDSSSTVATTDAATTVVAQDTTTAVVVDSTSTTTTTTQVDTTTTEVLSDAPPPLTAVITDLEDEAQVLAAVEELWVYYKWWLAHPTEPLEPWVDGGQAQGYLNNVQEELVSNGHTMRDGLTLLGIVDLAVAPGGIKALSLSSRMRRDAPRDLLDAATGDMVEVLREATGDTGTWEWGLNIADDGFVKLAVFGPDPKDV